MATNFVQRGETLPLKAPSGGVVSGVGYVIGGLFVVALDTVAEGLPFQGARSGVFEMRKATHASSKAFTEGEGVFWDSGNKRWDKTGSGFFQVGTVVADAASTADRALVAINVQTATAVV